MERAVNRLLRTTCILRLPAAIENHSQSPGPPFEAGATRPRDVFARNQCSAQCAKCVCEMREMIQETRQAFAMAAE